jgi:cysteine-rich repeat protein
MRPSFYAWTLLALVFAISGCDVGGVGGLEVVNDASTEPDALADAHLSLDAVSSLDGRMNAISDATPLDAAEGGTIDGGEIDAMIDARFDAADDADAVAESDSGNDAQVEAGNDAQADAGNDAQVDADAGPSCGNGVVEVSSGEQCDHGSANGTAGDGCSATCQIESGTYLDETGQNDTQATANDIDGYAGAVGQISPTGDVDWYAVSVTVAGSSITASIDDGFGACPLAFDSELSLYSPAGTLLATDLTGGVSPCSKVSPQVYPGAGNLPVGVYALAVQRVSAQPQPYYVLEVKVTPPSCGDGVLQPGEQCDPGPVTVPGCSATCQFTSDFIPETEQNDTQALANPLGTHQGFVASINPAGDLDYFSFNVPGPASQVSIQTSDGIGGCPPGFDSVLSLYDPSGALLVQDDNGGTGLCSLIAPQLYSQAMNLAAGTYVTRVEFKGGTSVQPEYVVTITVN